MRLSRRPVHVASRRRELARHSVFSSGSLPLRLHGNGAASLFLRRLGSSGRGFRASVWPSVCSIRANHRAAWRLASRQSAHPDARRLPPWERPAVWSPVAPLSLVCRWQPWCPADGGPALRYVGSRGASSYPTGCRLVGSSVIRLSVSSSRSDSLQSVFRTVCLTDLDGGCVSVGGRRAVFYPAVCFCGCVGAEHRIWFPGVEVIGLRVLRNCRAIRQFALSPAARLSGRSHRETVSGTRLSAIPKGWQFGCSPVVIV